MAEQLSVAKFSYTNFSDELSQTQNRTAHARESARKTESDPLRNMFQLQGFIFPAALVGLVLSGLVLQGSGSVTLNSGSGSTVQPSGKTISFLMSKYSYIWKLIFPLGIQLARLLTADMSFINSCWPINILFCCFPLLLYSSYLLSMHVP